MSLKKFLTGSRMAQVAVATFPTVVGLFPEKPAPLAPPLGALADLVSPMAFILVGLFGILPWFIKLKSTAIRCAISASIFSVISLIWYSVLVSTYVVKVERFIKNAKYQKFVKISKRYKAHDAGNTKKVGEKVEIIECRPLSKDKHFKVA